MKAFSKIFRMDISITMKLLFLNLMIFIVFGVIIGVMVLAFRDIEGLTAKIIDKDVRQIMDNGRLIKDFSLVFDRTGGLIGEFYRNKNILETEGSFLLKETNRLSNQNMDPNLKKSLEHFKTKLERLFKQCRTINEISAKILSINNELNNCILDLDEIISENLILLAMKGEDAAVFEQITPLISSYKESLLKISVRFAELETMHSVSNADSIISLLDDLQLRLRTLLASPSEISQYGHKLIKGVSAYKQETIAFNEAVSEFRLQLSELNQAKADIIAVMESMNEGIMDKFSAIRKENALVMQESMSFVYALSGTVIVLFGVFTYIFFLLNIRKPMETICKGLEFVGDGDMDARIRLNRNDEWSVIEEAINRMVGEIWNSYSELYRKNEELQRIHTELEASAKYLEAEIAERKRTEEKLWKSQRYIKNIIDSMPSVMIGVDTEGRITHWNMAAEKAVGSSTEEVLNKPVTDVYPELSAQMDRLQMSLSDIISPLKASKQTRRVQDEIRYEDIMIYPLIANGVEGAVIRVDDVTERVRIEEMMIQTEKMMSVGGLAAGMAHEINNPLGAILQGVQNALRRLSAELEANIHIAEECGTDLETIRSYLEKRGIFRYLNGVRESGLRAARIVSNMLNFSRQSATDMSLADINKLLDNTVELATSDYDLKKKYDFRQIQIIREYDAELPRTPCIPTEIEQVVLNLLRNSAQAMAEIKERTAAPVIILRTRKTSEYLLIEVEDNGPGMEEKIRTRIFEPFFTTKTVGVGTGLGLSVSYFIITNNHKGSIAVESEFGKGTKFIIRLPLMRRS
jgi:PAS domain S-box-containing protein